MEVRYVYDPWAKPEEVMHEYGITTLTLFPDTKQYTILILTVAHNDFLKY